MLESLINKLDSNQLTDIEAEAITDEELRQLVIHYATMIRQNRYNSEFHNRVVDIWDNQWPTSLRNRFGKMILDSTERENPDKFFWIRPAEINRKFGIKD